MDVGWGKQDDVLSAVCVSEAGNKRNGLVEEDSPDLQGDPVDGDGQPAARALLHHQDVVSDENQVVVAPSTNIVLEGLSNKPPLKTWYIQM